MSSREEEQLFHIFEIGKGVVGHRLKAAEFTFSLPTRGFCCRRLLTSSWPALLLGPAGGSEVPRTAVYFLTPPHSQHMLSGVTFWKNWVSGFLRLPLRY